MTDTRDRLIDAILLHVPFDGWSEAAFQAAIEDADVQEDLARGMFPRGARDLARAWHDRGDDAMTQAMARADLSGMRYNEKVAHVVRLRIEAIGDKEALRRATTQNVLPLNSPEGMKMLWQTADRIWTTLGDTSEDYNWYTKRALLSGVIGSTLLFWLGDDSPEATATWAFLDRRIDDVMQVEKVKARVTSGPLGRLFELPGRALSSIRPPRRRDDLPGA